MKVESGGNPVAEKSRSLARGRDSSPARAPDTRRVPFLGKNLENLSFGARWQMPSCVLANQSGEAGWLPGGAAAGRRHVALVVLMAFMAAGARGSDATPNAPPPLSRDVVIASAPPPPHVRTAQPAAGRIEIEAGGRISASANGRIEVGGRVYHGPFTVEGPARTV